MKKTLLLLLITFASTSAFAKLNVVVSIQPQLEFVNKIGGDKINTSLMVLPGNSPHTYEPKPSQMKAISKADLYLSIGVEFENVWLEKFTNQNRNLIVHNISKDIKRTAMQGHNHKGHHHQTKKMILDPHIWVNPIKVQQIAHNIAESLISLDANNSHYYQANLNNYLKELKQLDLEIRNILKDTPKKTTFMVFHPAWGYFAQQYGLHQLAIEVEGKTPKPKQLIGIIKEAKEKQVKAIFTQPEFSDQVAQTISKELSIQVIKTSPLSKNWSENLKKLAKSIALGSK
ncbi:MAG TPA: zinc ABC transporter substrate-binding protein [Campylobacterales bacterium]|nr:zinc ABC transporter substrate-binding protein [Campylobacterales bacterium]HIP41804.1 zinc ABC transporter substrate-binding protein [Campylobacterales bacterium]